MDEQNKYLLEVAVNPNLTWPQRISLVARDLRVDAARAAELLDPYYISVVYDKVPKDIVMKIGFTLDLEDIDNYCMISNNFRRSICNNDDFWIQRLLKEYGMIYSDFNNSSDRSVYTHVDTPRQFYERIHKINKLEKFVDTYKHTGYNIKLIDYYLEEGNMIAYAMKEVAKLPDTRGAIKVISHLHSKGAPLSDAMTGAAMVNNHYLMEWVMRKDPNNVNSPGAEGAAYAGNINLLKYFVDRGGVVWSEVALSAAGGGHVGILSYVLDSWLGEGKNVELLTPANIETYVDMVVNAAAENRYNILSWLVGFKGGEWSQLNTLLWSDQNLLREISNYMMLGAASGNHRDIIEKAIEIGANNYNMGLMGAVIGGYKEMVNYFINKGADDFKIGYSLALTYGNMKTAKYIWDLAKEKGYTIDVNLPEVYGSIIMIGNVPALLKLISKGFNQWDAALAIPGIKQDMVDILEMGQQGDL